LGGSSVVADAHIRVVPGTPIEHAGEICSTAKQIVAQKHPEVDLTIRAEALPLDQVSIAQTVRHVAARMGYNVHGISVHSAHPDGGDELLVGFDVEIDETISLREAHDRADELERAVSRQLGDGVLVHSHIDPMFFDAVEAAPLDPDRERALVASIIAAALSDPLCRAAREISVQDASDGLSISVSCRFDPALSLNAVHTATDGIENCIRRAVPGAGRIIVHAEPCDVMDESLGARLQEPAEPAELFGAGIM
jgi:divalent metal cation (Fe/Co/Zn/Cd) transporter